MKKLMVLLGLVFVLGISVSVFPTNEKQICQDCNCIQACQSAKDVIACMDECEACCNGHCRTN